MYIIIMIGAPRAVKVPNENVNLKIVRVSHDKTINGPHIYAVALQFINIRIHILCYYYYFKRQPTILSCTNTVNSVYRSQCIIYIILYCINGIIIECSRAICMLEFMLYMNLKY